MAFRGGGIGDAPAAHERDAVVEVVIFYESAGLDEEDLARRALGSAWFRNRMVPGAAVMQTRFSGKYSTARSRSSGATGGTTGRLRRPIVHYSQPHLSF